MEVIVVVIAVVLAEVLAASLVANAVVVASLPPLLPPLQPQPLPPTACPHLVVAAMQEARLVAVMAVSMVARVVNMVEV